MSRSHRNSPPFRPLLISLALAASAPGMMHGQAACEGRIAFVSERDGVRGIWVMQADGSQLRRLTSDPGDGQPVWSPDGARIAFQATRDADVRTLDQYGLAMHRMMYVMDANGGNVRRLTDTPAASLRWSPDAQHIAFQSSAEDEANWHIESVVSNAIYVIDADGRRQRRVTDLEHRHAFAAWSPDSRRVAFASDRDADWEIYVVDIEGGPERRLTNRAGPDRYPVWSPDGRLLAYAAGDLAAARAGGPAQATIVVLSLESGAVRHVVRTPENAVLRAWSPDGRQILFVTNDVLLVDHETGRVTLITDTPDARELGSAFLPGASKVAYRSDVDGNWEIYVGGTDGSGRVNVTNHPADDVLMSVGPCAPR